jgi:hypothetical protein
MGIIDKCLQKECILKVSRVSLLTSVVTLETTASRQVHHKIMEASYSVFPDECGIVSSIIGL